MGARPKRTKLTCYVLPEIKKAMQYESIDRNMSLGEIIEEALQTRMVIIRKER